jgi:hypothetical protein
MTRRRELAPPLAMAFGAALLLAGPAYAHEDPPGCFETGPAIVVSVFRADQVTGVVGSVSECETIFYRATLQKANDLDSICAFSEGTFDLTTPDGVVHSISADVPCIGGNTGLEGCDDTINQLQSSLISYTVNPADVVGGLITATATYTGGVAHDSPDNTPGVGASTPKSTPVVFCTDDNLCTIDVCNPALSGSDACSSTPVNCGDNDACTTEVCNPATGACVFTPVDCNDNDLCTTDTCNPQTGCVNTPVVCNDDNACTTDTCNPATGQCQSTNTVTCDDNDICTDDTCDPATGQCVFTPDPTNDPSCQNQAICRTPGFWSTHGDVSQQVIDSAGGCFVVCGEVITTATGDSVGNANSVLEATCVSPRGDLRLQLVRQLTAFALNCVVSGFGADCGGDADLADLFADCNADCLANTNVSACISAIDCFNNGGLPDPTTGACGSNPAGSCHERDLPDFLEQESADTSQACNAARKSDCTVISSGEAECTSGVISNTPEACL